MYAVTILYTSGKCFSENYSTKNKVPIFFIHLYVISNQDNEMYISTQNVEKVFEVSSCQENSSFK